MKFSVILPVYNTKDFEEAVQSVKNQTFTDYELLIADDGSTDEETLQALKNYEVMRLEKNEGAGAARQYAADRAKGEYLIFLDADDLFFCENTLKDFADFIEENDYPDAVRSKYIMLHNGAAEEKRTDQIYSLYGNAYKRLFLKRNGIKIPPFRYCEDCIFNALVNHTIHREAFLDKPTYVYRVNPNSLTQTTDFVKLSLAWLIKGNMLLYDHFIKIDREVTASICIGFVSYIQYYLQGLIYNGRMTGGEIAQTYELLKEWEDKTHTLQSIEQNPVYREWLKNGFQRGREHALWYVPPFVDLWGFHEFSDKVRGIL